VSLTGVVRGNKVKVDRALTTYWARAMVLAPLRELPSMFITVLALVFATYILLMASLLVADLKGRSSSVLSYLLLTYVVVLVVVFLLP